MFVRNGAVSPGPSRECDITFFAKGRPKSARQSCDSTVAARRVQSVTVPSSRVSREWRSRGLRSPSLKKCPIMLQKFSGGGYCEGAGSGGFGQCLTFLASGRSCMFLCVSSRRCLFFSKITPGLVALVNSYRAMSPYNYCDTPFRAILSQWAWHSHEKGAIGPLGAL